MILAAAVAVSARGAVGGDTPTTTSGSSSGAGLATPPTVQPASGPLAEVAYRRVQGQVTGGFQISPPRITDTVTPGTAHDFGLTVLNQTGHRRRFTLQVKDLAPGRGDTYAELAEPGTAERGAATWTTLRASTLDLDNLQQAIVPLRIAVPTGTDAGGHYAAIRVSSSDPAEKGEVRLETSIVAHLVIIVPGKVRYGLRITDVDVPGVARGRARVRLRVRNTGNIHSSPRLTLRLRGPLLRDRVEADVPEIMPGGERPMTLTWSDPPRLGRAVATLAATGEDGTTRRTNIGTIWIWSIPAAIAGGVLLAILAAAAWWWRRERALRLLMLAYDDEELEDDTLPE